MMFWLFKMQIRISACRNEINEYHLGVKFNRIDHFLTKYNKKHNLIGYIKSKGRFSVH